MRIKIEDITRKVTPIKPDMPFFTFTIKLLDDSDETVLIITGCMFRWDINRQEVEWHGPCVRRGTGLFPVVKCDNEKYYNLILETLKSTDFYLDLLNCVKKDEENRAKGMVSSFVDVGSSVNVNEIETDSTIIPKKSRKTAKKAAKKTLVNRKGV